MVWKKEINLEKINHRSENTAVGNLGILITGFTIDSLTATMPVDHRTIQPFQLLHGGASCLLAETLGSIASNLTLDTSIEMAVGQHIEASHFKSVKNGGMVKGVATPIHLGRSTQTWSIKIYDCENEKLVCDSKLITFIKKIK